MPIPAPIFLTGQNLAFAHDADTVPAPLTAHARTMDQGIYQVAEQFYVAVGYGNANMTMVVGTGGVILIDSSRTPGSRARSPARPAALQRPADPRPDLHPQPPRPQLRLARPPRPSRSRARPDRHLRARTPDRRCAATPASGSSPRSVSPTPSAGTSTRAPPASWKSAWDRCCALGTDRLPAADNPLSTACSTSRSPRHPRPPARSPERIGRRDRACSPIYGVLHSADVVQGECLPNLYALRGAIRDIGQWIGAVDLLRTFDAQALLFGHGSSSPASANPKRVICSPPTATRCTTSTTRPSA
ncbi:MAG: hypothetical protein U0841_32570 [Chloroflexia bacterium]